MPIDLPATLPPDALAFDWDCVGRDCSCIRLHVEILSLLGLAAGL